MDLSDIVAVSGMPGLFTVEARRQDGLILKAFGDERKQFLSSRKHVFSPLENITMYTQDDSIELAKVFESMKKTADKNSVPGPKTKDAELRDYFAAVVPDYDPERVYTSDIKKVIKWYRVLEEYDRLKLTEDKSDKKEAGEDKPAPKKSKAKSTKAKAKSQPRAKAQVKGNAAAKAKSMSRKAG